MYTSLVLFSLSLFLWLSPPPFLFLYYFIFHSPLFDFSKQNRHCILCVCMRLHAAPWDIKRLKSVHRMFTLLSRGIKIWKLIYQWQAQKRKHLLSYKENFIKLETIVPRESRGESFIIWSRNEYYMNSLRSNFKIP